MYVQLSNFASTSVCRAARPIPVLEVSDTDDIDNAEIELAPLISNPNRVAALGDREGNTAGNKLIVVRNPDESLSLGITRVGAVTVGSAGGVGLYGENVNSNRIVRPPPPGQATNMRTFIDGHAGPLMTGGGSNGNANNNGYGHSARTADSRRPAPTMTALNAAFYTPSAPVFSSGGAVIRNVVSNMGGNASGEGGGGGAGRRTYSTLASPPGGPHSE